MTRVAIFIKKDKPCQREVELYAQEKFNNVSIFCGRLDDPFPEFAKEKFNILISYLSPWIIPAEALEKADIAINFHPGPPEYPGTGCFNFALYDRVKSYGVTCHHMKAKVDTGTIVKVVRFPVENNDGVLSLTLKSYANMFALYTEIVDLLATGGRRLPTSEENWTRAPFKRAELEDLCRIRPEAGLEEIKRVVRATYYPGMPGPYFIDEGSALLLPPMPTGYVKPETLENHLASCRRSKCGYVLANAVGTKDI
jgi:methionyl-tRNA formyltransferase